MSEPKQNESVAEVLARMQNELNFQIPSDDGSPLPPAAQVNPAPSVPPAETVTAPIAAAKPEPTSLNPEQEGPEQDMEQVTQYMGSLLERYGSISEQEPTVPKPIVNAAAVEDFAIGETCEVPNLLSAGDYKPQKIAPEKKDNIAVMRELAVHSARKAIQESAKKKLQSDSSLRKSLAGACGIIGVGSLILSGLEPNLLSLLGITGIGSAVYFLYRIKQHAYENSPR